MIMKTDSRDNLLGEYIRAHRDAKRLSLSEAAKRSGLDYKYWSKVEVGELRQPNPRYLTAMAQTIGAPVEDLFGLVGYDLPERLPSFSPYLRTKYDLPPEAVAQLEQYFDMLRTYYGIPDDAPVFPPKPKDDEDDEDDLRPYEPSPDRRNDDTHPWRSS